MGPLITSFGGNPIIATTAVVVATAAASWCCWAGCAAAAALVVATGTVAAAVSFSYSPASVVISNASGSFYAILILIHR